MVPASVCVIAEKILITFCPSRGSNQDLLRSNPTLYHVTVKANLYRKAVQVRIVPSTTYFHLHVRFVPESQLEIHEPKFDTGVLRTIGWVILRWAPNCNRYYANTFCPR